MKKIGGALLVFLIPLVVFSSNWDSGWVLDDHAQVEENPHIRSFEHLPRILTTRVWESSSKENQGSDIYRPVFMVSYMVDYALFGIRPFWFHLMSDILHAINCVLLLFLALRFLSPGYALAAVLPFALHPIGVEAVTWVAARTDLLAAFFALANVLLMLRILEPGGEKRFGSWVLFALTIPLGLFSKEVFAPVPFFALLAIGATSGSGGPRRKYALAAGTFAVLMGAALLVRHRIVGPSALEYWTLDSLKNATAMVGRFFYLWFVPTDTDFFNQFQYAPFDWRHDLLPFVVCFSLVALWIWRCRKNRGLLMGALLFLAPLIPLLPVIVAQGLLPERYFYLPLAGFSLTFGIVISRLGGRIDKRLLWVILGIWLVCLTFVTVLRNREWRDEVRLYQASIQRNPSSWIPYFFLAWHYLRTGEQDLEVRYYVETLKRRPEYLPALNNLGVRYVERGKFTEAEKLLSRAWKAEPGRAKTAYNFGFLFESRRDLAEARKWYADALGLDPDYKAAKDAIARLTPTSEPR